MRNGRVRCDGGGAELGDLEKEIGEIESVADIEMVNRIADAKKSVTVSGEMTEITPDDIELSDTGEILPGDAEEFLPDLDGEPADAEEIEADEAEELAEEEIEADEAEELAVEEIEADEAEELAEEEIEADEAEELAEEEIEADEAEEPAVEEIEADEAEEPAAEEIEVEEPETSEAERCGRRMIRSRGR